MNAVILNGLQHFGYLALWLIVFVAAVGIPVSGSLLMFAAGAFAAFGDFNMFILFPVALSAAVMGDNLGYGIGRWVGIALISWIERQKRFRWMSPEAVEKGREYFRRRTGWAIFLTRFLIVALGGPINILAGLEHYSYRRFLFWDISGQALCALITLGLGFVFAESWLEVATIFGTFSSLFLALMVTVILFMVILRRIRHARAAKAAKDESAKVQQTDEETIDSSHVPDQDQQQSVIPAASDTEPEPASLPQPKQEVPPSLMLEQIEEHVESPIPD